MRFTMLAAALAALLVLFLATLAGSNIRRAQAIGDVKKVSITKRMMVQPKLEVNAPSAPAPSAQDQIEQPQIARTASIGLYVSRVDDAVTSLVRLARNEGGDLFSLQADNEGASDGSASADIEVRIPASRFDDALTALARVGKIRKRSIYAEDLTANLTDSTARLRNLRRTESDIRAIMDRSGSVSQVMDAENQLSQVREQIETLESELKAMRGRVSYSTIDVNVRAEAAAAPVEPTAASQLATAWRAAVHALSQTTIALAATLLWMLAFIPYALIAAAIAVVVRLQIKRPSDRGAA